MTKTVKNGLRLVVDNSQNKLEKFLDDKIEADRPKSKSEFVNQVTSFCDELDRQIEEIMKM
jgi:hypothetical protein